METSNSSPMPNFQESRFQAQRNKGIGSWLRDNLMKVEMGVKSASLIVGHFIDTSISGISSRLLLSKSWVKKVK